MAVVGTAKERPDQRSAVMDHVTSKWTYRRTYLVKTEDPQDGSMVVTQAPGLPLPFTIYSTERETDQTSVVVRYEPRQLRRTPYHWEVGVVYEPVDPRQREADPRLWLPKMSWRPERERVPVIGTLKPGVISPSDPNPFSKPILNSAGEPFDPQPMMGRSNGTLIIVRNQVSFDPYLATLFEDAVNEDFWGGYQPGQCKLEAIDCPGRETATVSQAEIFYYPTSWTIKIRRETHDLRILDQGRYYFETTGSTGRRLTFTSSHDGRSYIGKLDGRGRSLQKVIREATSGSSWHNSTVNAVYLRFRAPKQMPFGLLNLPQTFI